MRFPKPVSRIRRIAGISDLGRTDLPEPPLKYTRRYMKSLKDPQIHLGDKCLKNAQTWPKTVKGDRPIWRYKNSTRVFGVLTSPAQKHLVIDELVSGRSLPVLLWPQSKILGILHIRNWLCHMFTMDILVPEMSVPNEPPWFCALFPLGEKLRERLQILTWSEQAQQEHERSQMVSWEFCCCSYRSPHHPPSRRESSWGFLAVEAHEGLNEDLHSTRSFPN